MDASRGHYSQCSFNDMETYANVHRAGLGGRLVVLALSDDGTPIRSSPIYGHARVLCRIPRRVLRHLDGAEEAIHATAAIRTSQMSIKAAAYGGTHELNSQRIPL